MIISTKKGTPQEELDRIVDKFEKQGLSVTLISGTDYNVFGLVGDTTKLDERDILANPWVDNVTRVSAPYKRANRLFHPEDSVIDCGGVKIGGHEKIAVMAGPCSIENEEQAKRIASSVKAGGAALFRGGAYKPRTSPYSFQGLETEGILDMVKAREATGLPIVSELMSEDRIPEFEEYVDVVQIGARNMQNFQLLKAVGKMHKPVLLKRGLCNTIEEWIMSAEYIMAGGNENVILCERGIRTFEKYTRNTLDLSAVPIIHEKTHLPVVVDPSHATGKSHLVEPMMIAAVAAGADGLEVEVHYDPQHAWSDGAQCLTPDAFAQAMAKCRQVAWAIGRDMQAGGPHPWDSGRAPQQEHGPQGAALRGPGRGDQPGGQPGPQPGHRRHPGRRSRLWGAGGAGDGLGPCDRAGCPGLPGRPGGLLRERQHPALSDPAGGAVGAGGHLYRAGPADAAAPERVPGAVCPAGPPV